MGNRLSLSRSDSSVDSVRTPPNNVVTGNVGSFEPGVCGLVNMGVTDNMSVAIQLLSNCPPLTDYFLSNQWTKEVNESNPMGRGGHIAKAYASLVESLWSGANAPVNPSHLRSAFSEAFSGFVTEDAFEFLHFLLVCLHEDLNRIRNPPPSPKASSNSRIKNNKADGIAPLAQEACENYKKRNDSIVSDLFHGFLTAREVCSCCENITCCFETLADITLWPPEEQGSKVELTDCLRHFTRTEEVGNLWCENCMHKEPATQKLDIWSAPRIFVFHLMRSRFKDGHSHYRKNKTFVNFPIRDLDLGPFILSNIEGKPIIYDLIGVINHDGECCRGHYYAYCLNKTDGRWYNFDDESVNSCSEESVPVSGYVLIGNNELINLSLPNLEIIRGDRSQEGTALHVFNNPNLLSLNFPRLRSIYQRNVFVSHNKLLCTWPSINWRNLLSDPKNQNVTLTRNQEDCPLLKGEEEKGTDFVPNQLNLDAYLKRVSESAAEQRKLHFLLGPGSGPMPDVILKDVHKEGCAAQCPGGECWAKGGGIENCCHRSCVGGCTGPTDGDCLACRAFENNHQCINHCPDIRKYDIDLSRFEDNPDGRYAYHYTCVLTCPSNMLIFDDACVSSCPEGYYSPDSDGGGEGPFHCRSCSGPCPKNCRVPRNSNGGSLVVYKEMLPIFENCTEVDGSIKILYHSFQDSMVFDAEGVRTPYKVGAVSREDLEIFTNVQKVTGHVQIQSHELTDMDFLRNLKVIYGRELHRSFALDISGNDELRTIGFRSLKSIQKGDVFISQNYDLCLSDLDWPSILGSGYQAVVKQNRAPNVCKREGNRGSCHRECDASGGCWGPEPDQCLRCSNFTLNRVCVPTCNTQDGHFETGPSLCQTCDSNCLTCNRPSVYNCTACRYFNMTGSYGIDGQCVESCPVETHYVDGIECLRCHRGCSRAGCTGPSFRAGPGGCLKCQIGILEEAGESELRCLDFVTGQPTASCREAGYTSHYAVFTPERWKNVSEDYVCLPCDSACKACSGDGTSVDDPSKCVCKSHLIDGNRCVSHCPSTSTYLLPSRNPGLANCSSCHAECKNGCFGLGPHRCKACRHFSVSFESSETHSNLTCVFNCTGKFPYAYKQHCYKYDIKSEKDRQFWASIGGGVAAALLLFLLLLACVIWYMRKVQVMKYLYTDFDIPESAGYKPNMNRLRIIQKTELRWGEKLGEGAFGVVVKGLFVPVKDSVPVPVAIKSLTRIMPGSQKELLDEAVLMGSINHPHIVRLVGVCVSQEIYLVTPLMPLGNLREYLKNNKNSVSALSLLKWAGQIASGMEHLESEHLVHRDLAARNVLVRNPGHVVITDFSLAKLIPYGKKGVNVEDRVPFKWLAPECMESHSFTSKSDVWAYGVTIWEMLTFGRDPYGNTGAQQLLNFLWNGLRLEQPETCSIELYMILMKCWLLEAESRPTFSELSERMSEMLKFPTSCVIIKYDHDHLHPI